jgi:hypothetical protein
MAFLASLAFHAFARELPFVRELTDLYQVSGVEPYRHEQQPT